MRTPRRSGSPSHPNPSSHPLPLSLSHEARRSSPSLPRPHPHRSRSPPPPSPSSLPLPLSRRGGVLVPSSSASLAHGPRSGPRKRCRCRAGCPSLPSALAHGRRCRAPTRTPPPCLHSGGRDGGGFRGLQRPGGRVRVEIQSTALLTPFPSHLYATDANAPSVSSPVSRAPRARSPAATASPLLALHRGPGLARHAGLAVFLGPARPDKRPSRPCLGRRSGTLPTSAWPGRHDVPCRPKPHRAVPGTGPCRAGPDRSVGHLYSRSTWAWQWW
ncbi:uncharacterized protein [Miscanthus floridulus]|uniref:uncharacterized protein n=1 Tax=Miscanthus floridulus TaxID=154761 RepID=UPI0034581037